MQAVQEARCLTEEPPVTELTEFHPVFEIGRYRRALSPRKGDYVEYTGRIPGMGDFPVIEIQAPAGFAMQDGHPCYLECDLALSMDGQRNNYGSGVQFPMERRVDELFSSMGIRCFQYWGGFQGEDGNFYVSALVPYEMHESMGANGHIICNMSLRKKCMTEFRLARYWDDMISDPQAP